MNPLSASQYECYSMRRTDALGKGKIGRGFLLRASSGTYPTGFESIVGRKSCRVVALGADVL
jgi:hypothetical protein